jgi:hypothetical protein
MHKYGIDKVRGASYVQIELDELNRKYDEKRRKAMEPNHPTFTIDGIIISQLVFEEDELEDLTPFPELVDSQNDENSNYDIVASNQYDEEDNYIVQNNDDNDGDDEDNDGDHNDEEEESDDIELND